MFHSGAHPASTFCCGTEEDVGGRRICHPESWLALRCRSKGRIDQFRTHHIHDHPEQLGNPGRDWFVACQSDQSPWNGADRETLGTGHVGTRQVTGAGDIGLVGY